MFTESDVAFRRIVVNLHQPSAGNQFGFGFAVLLLVDIYTVVVDAHGFCYKVQTFVITVQHQFHRHLMGRVG